MNAIILDTKSTDAVYNLAYEEYVLQYAKKMNSIILYLWQNENSVIIGRNQNAYTETNLYNIEKYSVKLLRRLTGGGAVYHDLGNLNYTFIVPKDIFDISETTNIIVESLRNIGLHVEVSGRNDILINGYKFSGNAYYSNENLGMHHGTILVDTDIDKMNKVLSPFNGRMSLKGVKSVKGRVINLTEIDNNICVEVIKDNIKNTFREHYCMTDVDNVRYTIDMDNLMFNKLYDKYASKKWNIELVNEYAVFKTMHFEWGNLKVSFKMEGNDIVNVMISSDSLYPDLIDAVKAALDNLANKKSQYQEMFYVLIEKNTEVSKKIILNDIRKTYIELLNSLEVWHE